MEEMFEGFGEQSLKTVGDLINELKKHDPRTPITMYKAGVATEIADEIDGDRSKPLIEMTLKSLQSYVSLILRVHPDLTEKRVSKMGTVRPFKMITYTTRILAIHDEESCKSPEND